VKREIVFDQGFYEALTQLELVARQPSGGRLEGARTSRRTGSGIEFAEWRPYAAGDSVRDIDWRALGRLGRLFVRVRAREEASRVTILVDATASMRYGRPSKFTVARRTAAALAAVALASMDAVALGFIGGEGIRPTAWLTGTSALSEVLRLLEEARVGEAVDHAAALTAFLSRSDHSGLLIVISDFWTDSDMAGVLGVAAERGFEGALIQVLHPDELRPSAAGRVRLLDAESDAELELVVTAGARDAYVEECSAHIELLRRAAVARGFGHVVVESDTPLDVLLLRDLRRAGVLS
jgi:uncharacterized protein (DUF58 family)